MLAAEVDVEGVASGVEAAPLLVPGAEVSDITALAEGAADLAALTEGAAGLTAETTGSRTGGVAGGGGLDTAAGGAGAEAG